MRRLFEVVQIREQVVRGTIVELLDVATDPLPREQALAECDAERDRNDDPQRQFYIRDSGLIDWSRELQR